jgi:hypothetical protein
LGPAIAIEAMRKSGGIGRGIARIAQSPGDGIDMPPIDRTAGAGESRREAIAAAAPAPRGIRTSRIGRSRATSAPEMRFDGNPRI